MILSYLLLLKTDIGLKKNSPLILSSIIIMWPFKLGLFQNSRGVSAKHESQRFDSLIECKPTDGTCKCCFSQNKNTGSLTRGH